MTPIVPGLCNFMQTYNSGRTSTRLCTLDEAHEGIAHTDGRVTWTEKTSVVPNRADKRRMARAFRRMARG
jgi:hypothetical protein